MSIAARSLLGIAAAAVVLVLVRHFEHGERYAFGHPGLVDLATAVLLWVLTLTHAVIAIIMWLQRRRWLPSDAAMFRFVAVKALLWANLATAYVARERGITLDVAALYVLIALTTIDLDIRLVRRYVWFTTDEREPVWDGTLDRRGPEPGRRWLDRQRKGADS